MTNDEKAALYAEIQQMGKMDAAVYWQLVPIIPTAKMIDARSKNFLRRIMSEEPGKGLEAGMHQDWADMLAAAPRPPDHDLSGLLIAAAKWLERISDRRSMLPASFLDNTDPAPLAMALRLAEAALAIEEATS